MCKKRADEVGFRIAWPFAGVVMEAILILASVGWLIAGINVLCGYNKECGQGRRLKRA